MTLWDETTVLRAAVMREGLDIAHLRGLEIGPLANPIVPHADGEVLYVDQADTESLRHTYATDPHIDARNIVEVDAVWGERTLTDCLGGAGVDYIMASHVAEHVPDLITWLEEAGSVLRPGGQLRLALPDMRFSHDALRASTGLSHLLTAWLLRMRRPQVFDVLDFRLNVASAVDGERIYREGIDLSAFVPDHSFAVALDAACAARDRPDRYFDVHCLVVSAKSFAGLMVGLAGRGLLSMRCIRMIDTAPPLFEFYAFLQRCENAVEITRSWEEAYALCQDPLPGSAAARRLADDGKRDARCLALEQEVERLRAELASARARTAAMEKSRSWRITAPLRRLRGVL
jgi:SAM-dependent methyltransferase